MVPKRGESNNLTNQSFFSFARNEYRAEEALAISSYSFVCFFFSCFRLLSFEINFIFIPYHSIKCFGFCPLLFRFVCMRQSENFAEENELALDDELCYGKRCTMNEHCCPGSVCVDVDGGKKHSNLIFVFFTIFFCSVFAHLELEFEREKKRENKVKS